MLLATEIAIVELGRLEFLVAAVRGELLQRWRSASISASDIGWKLRATPRFCSRTYSESMPLIVVATGRLIA